MRYTPESERLVLLMRNWEWFLLLVMASLPLVGTPSFSQITLGGGEPWVVTGDGTRGHLGGIWGQALSHCPGVSCQALRPGVWRGAEAEAETMLAAAANLVKWWASGGQGRTHREGGMDTEGCPSANHHMTFQPGTEVKLGSS